MTGRLPLLSACVVLALAGACAPRVAAPRTSSTVRTVLLLAEAPERDTEAREDRREDVQVETSGLDRVPRVVARGETSPLSLDGARARLYGDAEGTRGWSVDNFILFEVLDAAGAVTGRFACGYTDGVWVGRESVDLVGPRGFAFEPGQVDLSEHLPETGAFRLRATALDYQGVGRTAQVYLRLEPRPAREERADE
ncbi:MAG: hypothetical protein RL653_2134 [Pseudomonadota bacterium]|jgi:hypothetical protein